MKKPSLTTLKDRLNYDPNTGAFTWRSLPKKATPHIGDVAGHAVPDGHLRIGLDGIYYMAHRLAWQFVHGDIPDLEIDHINGDPGDNRIANLRLATRAENGSNRTLVQSNNKTGLKGVCLKCGKYRAQIKVRGKTIHLGTFEDPLAAYEVYATAAVQYFGEFARVA